MVPEPDTISRSFPIRHCPLPGQNNLQKVDAPYIRYTEILLNYVEANINLGDEAEAISWLNKLRFRNGLPAVTASGADLLEVYKRERDKELVNEDARLFDMKRWLEGPLSLNKQVQTVLIQGNPESGNHLYGLSKRHGYVLTIHTHRRTLSLRIESGKIMFTLCRLVKRRLTEILLSFKILDINRTLTRI